MSGFMYSPAILNVRPAQDPPKMTASAVQLPTKSLSMVSVNVIPQTTGISQEVPALKIVERISKMHLLILVLQLAHFRING